jgi:hypothetical protein
VALFTESSTDVDTSTSKELENTVSGDVLEITPASPDVQIVENRLVPDPTDPLTAIIKPEPSFETEPVEQPKALKIDLSTINLDDDLLDEESLLPDPTKVTPLSQHHEHHTSAAVSSQLDRDELHVPERHQEIVVPDRPGREHHTPVHAHDIHELITPPERPIGNWASWRHARKAKRSMPEERHLERHIASDDKPRHREAHQPQHAGELHHDLDARPYAAFSHTPTEIALEQAPETPAHLKRRLDAITFLLDLRTKPAYANDDASASHIQQLLNDEVEISRRDGADEEHLRKMGLSSVELNLPFPERTKEWFSAATADLREFSGMTYFAQKAMNPGDWLMNREGGHDAARISLLLGSAAEILSPESIAQRLKTADLPLAASALQLEQVRTLIGEGIQNRLTTAQREEYQAIINDDQAVIHRWLEQNVPEYNTVWLYQQFKQTYSDDPEHNSPEKLFANIAWVKMNVPNLQALTDGAIEKLN